MARKDPRRTAATKRRIQEAFWMLYCGSDCALPSATAVAKEAGINRSTFYEYFQDVRDILESVEDELLAYMQLKAGEIFEVGDVEEAARLARVIFEEKGDYLSVFLGAKRSDRLIGRVREILGGFIVRGLSEPDGKPSEIARYKAEFIASGVIGTYTRWIEEGRPVPIENVASMIKTSVSAVIA